MNDQNNFIVDWFSKKKNVIDFNGDKVVTEYENERNNTLR
jgi:hypothetical protein